jgi:hypothetical protein
MFKRSGLIIMLVVAGMLLAACGGGSAAAVDEVQAAVEEQEAGEEVVEVSEPAVVEAEEPESEESEEGESAEEIPVTGAEIEHQVFPETFILASLQRVIDCNTGRRAANDTDPIIAPDCDEWNINRYERPVDAAGESYIAAVDILITELGQDADWIYAQTSFFMIGEEAPVLSGSYALEIDLDLDARGDLLVLVNNPAAMEPGEWGVAGVQVWKDANGDVGNQTAVLADEGAVGDGFETMLFDSGMGDDPDLAWARINPEEPNIVELSFKKSLLEGHGVFSWWSWASAEPFDLTAFDYDDTYGEDGLTSLDNTCAWMFGQAPLDLPNMCQAIVVPTAEPEKKSGTCSPPPGGCGQYQIWIQELCACVTFN